MSLPSGRDRLVGGGGRASVRHLRRSARRRAPLRPLPRRLLLQRLVPALRLAASQNRLRQGRRLRCLDVSHIPHFGLGQSSEFLREHFAVTRL